MKGWRSARLEEIPERNNGWVPVRDHLGIEAFGVNAWKKRQSDGALIAPHNEIDTRHEELYYVYRGHAVFTIGDDEIDAPEGTIVFVRDPELMRGAQPKDDDTIILSAGGKPGAPFNVSDWELNWEWNSRAYPLYNDKKYAEAAAVLHEALAAGRDDAGIHYNLACFESLAGNTEAALEHLRTAIEKGESFREFAKNDSDLDPIRNEPGYPN
jgi:tetratricopeptide (TPR) repeat protein